MKEIGVFLEVEVQKQEVFPLAGKNTDKFLVSCHTWKYVSTATSSGIDISEVPGCYLLQQMSSQWGSQKLIHGLVPELYEMAILSKAHKPDHFESHNSLKPSFPTNWALHSNFEGFESSFNANTPDILALWLTNLDDSIYSCNFPLIWKDFITHRDVLAVYMKLTSNLL